MFFNIFGLIVYLILRPPEYLADVQERELEILAKEETLNSELTCYGCHQPIEPDFLICPYCMKRLKKSCPACNHPLDLNWKVCPYCKTSL
ncbi:zinc ribbon domain-containing protein [Candidatus Oleimmundimicrobium sp.]|uniref:zinc ribbon domain-containing protein n=1 Tax=Candidatus Oleimmundimicrobium sp. TaxID=3060597 RepID=UPI00271A6005|nr:zinc ribbon domain-containing protein [Candidatus Oleimmundimicrobium sp.]MDO8886127.1 zinc ribbon domain-containing protein [Candidatus Oleimmundimicrobium sp.]